ncbi:MAG TPA: NAD(+)/NADH kinase [Acidimicrobiales bacterium]|nr:NAD(+)/NADH kinase [Acidimicrobiales bacterium]
MSSCVGLVTHHERPAARDLARDIAAWLRSAGHEVHVPATDAGVAGGAVVPDERFAEGLDIAVSIGGDGTMLRTVALVAPAGVPILGINRGHLGYLTVVEADAWRPALARVLSGDFATEQRMTLDVSICGRDGVTYSPRTALNDAVVEKSSAGHTVRVAVAISGQHAISYAADALIVSTPTGSTAYNLSAGGPIVSPNLSALVVTPVAAHSLFGRPLVVGPGEVVRVALEEGGAVLGVDGVHVAHLTAGDVVECRESATPARLVTLGGRDFWEVVTAKFGLDVR